MSGDEGAVMILATFAAGMAWAFWLWQAAFTARRCSGFAHRWPLTVYPGAAFAILYGILKRFSSPDVREAPVYLAFYMILGAAWVGAVARLLPYLGLRARDDVIERGNFAAGQAIGGALLGLTLCYAGANIGNGPGWWVVVFSAFLATVALLLLWVLLDKATGLADTLTIDRDLAAGLRAVGFFTGAGLILGRAVAGDWTSAADTAADFARTGWPALLLWAVAAFLEKWLRPKPEQPQPPIVTHGLAPLLLYLGIAAFFLMRMGWWS
jgi:uncharacterized membrane protein YjfL (UPF0719 family)